MSTALMHKNAGDIMERVIAAGDLSKLTATERTVYYSKVCESVGLNPLTRPFEYIQLNGKLTLYARKDCTDQLRKINRASLQIVCRERLEDVYVVTARATTPDGRTDESIGAVNIATLKGDALANALMKAETKAKRRVTLSICGLGWLDETEIETIPDARPFTEETPLTQIKKATPPVPARLAADPQAPLPSQQKKSAPKPPRKERLIARIEEMWDEEIAEFGEIAENPDKLGELDSFSEGELEELGKTIGRRLTNKRNARANAQLSEQENQ